MFRQRRAFVFGFVTLAVVTCLVQIAAAQFGRGPAPREARGVLKAVDAAAGTITLTVGDGRQAAEEKTFAIAKEAEVAFGTGADRRFLFKPGKLADVAAGAIVTLSLSEDEKTAEVILAQGPQARGVIKSVDAAKRQLTLTQFPSAREQSTEEKLFTLSESVEVGVDDGRGRRFSIREGSLTDLVADALVTLQLSPDLKEVQSILSEGANLSGIVRGINADKRSLTIVVGSFGGRGEPGEERTWDVPSDAVVLLDDGRGRRLSIKEGTLAEIPTGAMVRVKLSADQRFVMQVTAEGPNLPGLLKSVDAAKRTITVAIGGNRNENPEEKTLTVADDARIMIDNTASKLTDVRTADNGPFVQLRLSLDQQTVQGIFINTIGR